MLAPFDIFKVDADGPLWLGAAETLEQATARVQALGKSDPAEYLIVSQKTGDRIRIKVNGCVGEPQPTRRAPSAWT